MESFPRSARSTRLGNSAMNIYEVLIDYPDVLTPEDLQEVLRLDMSTVYELLLSGVIRSIRIGKTYRIPKLYLLEYLYPGNNFFDLDQYERNKHDHDPNGDNPSTA